MNNDNACKIYWWLFRGGCFQNYIFSDCCFKSVLNSYSFLLCLFIIWLSIFYSKSDFFLSMSVMYSLTLFSTHISLLVFVQGSNMRSVGTWWEEEGNILNQQILYSFLFLFKFPIVSNFDKLTGIIILHATLQPHIVYLLVW